MIDVKKFTMAIVSLAVAILLVLTVLVPVISDTTSNSNGGTGNYTNTGEYRYAPITQDTNKEIELQLVDNVFNISVDDTIAYTIPITENMNVFVPLFIAEKEDVGINFIGILFNSATYENNSIHIFDITSQEMLVDSNFADYGTSIFTITNGSVEYEIGSDVYPYDQTFIYSIDPNGDYIYSSNPVVANDSEIYFIDNYQEPGYPNVEDQHFYMIFFFGSGNINDLQIESVAEIVSDNISTSDYGSAKKIDSVSITWSPLDPELENESATFGKFIVPMEVAGAGGSSEGMSPTLVSMLSVIPLIVVVGLILGAITMFVKRE